MNKMLKLLATFAIFCFNPMVYAATDWSAQDYDLYPGDFNGDGRSDILYVAKDVTKPSGIALSDGNGPNIPSQSWPSNYLGIPWGNNTYKPIVGNFNNDNKADILMQRSTPGDHYLLLADSTGKISGISQMIPNDFQGIAWSADQHVIHAGSFGLFFQATSPAGVSAIVPTYGTGQFYAPSQVWNDGYLGFKWSTQNSLIYVGDFNGDQKTDLLIQARPRMVLIDYEIPIPVPTYPPNMNGVVLNTFDPDGGPVFTQLGVRAFSRFAFGVDWSPLTNNIVIGDFNGDGRSDVLLQAKHSGRTSFLATGNGSGAVLANGTALANNVELSAAGGRIVAGKFGTSFSSGVYLQALTPVGTNFLASNITGATITTTVHDPAAATGVVPANTVGVTSGAFSIGNDGSANYSIPIVVPPGVAGVQPQIALAYSNRRGNGWVGVGWDISGLSQIGRCARNLAQDGVAASVSLTMTDRFCLDGNRLRLTGGTYGAAGSTYQTELETFARVTAFGTAGNGPAYFIVEAKNGLKYEYGNTANSRIESLGTTTPRVWALNKVTDRSGNVMAVSYSEDTVNGAFHPDEILYTANASANVSAAYKVKFLWENRPSTDKMSGYFAGSLIREAFRLNRIETQFNDPAIGSFRTVRRYQLSYTFNNNTWRSRLGAVQECDGAGNCLEPTSISWQDGQAGLNGPVSSGSGGSLAQFMLPIDMNGDGRADRVYPGTSGTWQFMLANASGGFGSAQNSGIDNGKYEVSVPIDYNSDGKIDVLTAKSDGTARVLQSTGTGFVALDLGFFTPAVTGSGDFTVTDVNGDGRPDYVEASVGDSDIYARLNGASGLGALITGYSNASTSGSTSSFFNRYYRVPGAPGAGLILSDVDADGRGEVIVPVGLGSATNSMHYDSSTLPPLLGRLINDASTRVADFNGDGNDDVAYICGGTWCLRFGTGKTFGPEVNTGQSAFAGGAVVVIDWDNDGKMDLLQSSVPDGEGTPLIFYLLRSTGESLAPNVSTGISSAGVLSAKAVDVNGDGLLDLSYTDSSGNFWVRTHRGGVPDLVTAISDGFGNATSITYSALTDTAPLPDPVYSKGSGAAFPQMDVQSAMYVVKKYSQTDGIGGSFTVKAFYTGARTDLSGRGFLGFASRRLQDSRNGSYVYDYFRQDFPFVGQVSQRDEFQSDNTLIQRVTNDYASTVLDSTANNQRYLVTQTHSVAKRYEVGGAKNGLLMEEETSTFAYDSFGNATQITATTVDRDATSPFFNQTWQTRLNNDNIVNNTAAWCLGQPTQRRVTSTLPDGSSQTRTLAYAVDATVCRTTQEVVEPASNTRKVTRNFGFDSCGNVNSIGVVGKNPDGSDLLERTSSFEYGGRCTFPETITNALGQVTTTTYRYDLGVRTSVRDPNLLTTTLHHDGFGRLLRVSSPDGTATDQYYLRCTAANNYCGIPDLRFQVQTIERDTSNAQISRSITYFDGLGRERILETQRATGGVSYVSQSYDSFGRPVTTSQPYSNTPNGLSRGTYDLLNRLTRVDLVRPDNTVDRSTLIAYAGGSVAITDARGNTVEKILDAVGRLRRVIDASGTTQYDHDHFGNLTTVIDPANNTKTSAFDIRGFETSSSDPDLGNWTYDYNSLGELVSQRDAKNQFVTFFYDRLGRLTKRTEPEGDTLFTFDTAAHGIGELATVSSPGGYGESFSYDVFGRTQSVTYQQDTSYQIDYAYNNQGLLDSVTYPTSTNSYRLKLKYGYAFGALTQVKDFNDPGRVFWTLNATDDADNPIDESLGNGVRLITSYDPLTGELDYRQSGNNGSLSNLQHLAYQWNKNGNLEQRQDVLQNLTEAFEYDNLDRLTRSTLNGATNLSLSFDALGNITSKSDVGAYDYTTPQAGCSYHPHAQPHAVRKAGNNVYCYDQNGNMTQRAGGAITWTSYNLPSAISAAGNSSQFSYNANRERWRQVATAGGTTETTIYVAGLLDKVTRGGVTEYRHYIAGGSDATTIYTRRSDGTSDTYYTTTDHLGSTDVITDHTGAVKVRESFTAFGARRGSNWTGAPSASDFEQIAAITRDGFTGHEHLDNLNLIHMNGRVYDPTLGRFISADPFVQAPEYSQSLNRYSYVSNSPLSYTDPSGFWFGFTSFAPLGIITISADFFVPPGGFSFPSFDPRLAPFLNPGPGRPTTVPIPGIPAPPVAPTPVMPPAAPMSPMAPVPMASTPAPRAAVNDTSFFSTRNLRGFVSDVVSSVPIVGQVKSVVEVVTGRDYIGGRQVSRLEAASGLVPYGRVVGSAVKAVSKVVRAGRTEAKAVAKATTADADGRRFTVRRFMSRDELKQIRKSGVEFDPQKGNGIPTTTRKFNPRSQDQARQMTGANAVDVQVDFDVTDLPRGPTTVTKSGLPEFPVQGDLTADRIISGSVRRVPK